VVLYPPGACLVLHLSSPSPPGPWHVLQSPHKTNKQHKEGQSACKRDPLRLVSNCFMWLVLW